MSARNLVLNDGTTIEDGDAGLSSSNNLWLWFTGYTMMQVALMFLDTEKTSRITFHQSEDVVDVYEGYTNCININMETNGQFHVCLTREG